MTKILVVLAALDFLCGGWNMRPFPHPRRTGGFADFAHLIYAALAVYGSAFCGMAVQIVRTKRTTPGVV